LPRFQVATEADRRQWEKQKLESQLKWQFPDLTGESLPSALEATQALWRSASVACHREGSDTILLLPEQLAGIARWDGSLAAVATSAFFQLALVHETVRWVLDQRYGLARRRAACRDWEMFQALQALVEGRAQWVTRQVAVKMGTEASFPLLARLMLHA